MGVFPDSHRRFRFVAGHRYGCVNALEGVESLENNESLSYRTIDVKTGPTFASIDSMIAVGPFPTPISFTLSQGLYKDSRGTQLEAPRTGAKEQSEHRNV